MSIRVFLVDDQVLVRAGFVMVVDSQPDMIVAGQATDGYGAMEGLVSTTVDVVLMDVRMPRMDGVEATRRVLAECVPAPKVIMLTTYDVDEHAFAALQAGASGFLIKDTDPEDLLTAIRTVHRGDAVIAPSTTRRLLDHVAGELPTRQEGPDPLMGLTGREREVLIEVARGASNAEIAERMYLSEGTVKTHVGRILHKLGMRDRIHAVIFAYEQRLIRPGPLGQPRAKRERMDLSE